MFAMVCDDDAAARFVMKRLLTQHLGCTVIECEDGVEALTRLDAGPIDVVFLDVQMPNMDGVEVLEAIRSAPSLKHLPVVAVSNERREEVVRRLVALRLDGYVLKPIRVERLLSALEPLRGRLARRAGATGSARQICLGPDTAAMLVDGNLDYRHFFASQVQRYGPVVEVSSGAAALATFKNTPAHLVFLGEDIGVLRHELLVPKLRALAAGQPIRIVRLFDGEDGGAVQAGCDDVMRRTFLPEVFRRAIRSFVRTPGGLAAVTGMLGDFEAVLTSATRQVFGMMLDSEIDIVSAQSDLPPYGGATGEITIAGGYRAAFKLFGGAASLRQLASRMLGMSPEEVTDEDALSTAGELVNLLTGRLHAILDEHHVVSECSLPTIVPSQQDWGIAEIGDRGALVCCRVKGTAAEVAIALEVVAAPAEEERGRSGAGTGA